MKKIKIYCSFLLIFLAFYTTPADSAVPDTIKIIHITDTHLIYHLDHYHSVVSETRQHYSSNTNPLKTFFNTVPESLNADAVLITGDILDYFEAEIPDGSLLATQIEQFFPLYTLSPVPVYMTLGNHDIFTYVVDEKKLAIQEYPIQEGQINSQLARATWIRNIPCFQNGTFYSRNFRVGKTNYRFIFLDNGYYNLHDDGKILDKPQLDWLNNQIDESKDDPVILFMHIYLPVGDKNSDGVYFKKNDLNWPDMKNCSQGLLKILNDRKNIKAMFVGHGHKNVIEEIDFPGGNKIIQCETGAFGRNPNNWRLLQFTEDRIIINEVDSIKPERIIIIDD